MPGLHLRTRRRARQVHALAAASRRYSEMPPGPTPLAGPLEVVNAFLRAWETRDAAALARLFADDADFVNVVGLWWTSRRSIERVFKRAFKHEFTHARFDFEKISFRQAGSDAAVLLGRWQITGQVDPDGEPADPRRGVLTFVLERVQDGTWLIVTAQTTDIVPAADTNLARGGSVTATSYLPSVPDSPADAADAL